jgi:hypothetical protein
MTDDNKENSVTKKPLDLFHQGECQGVAIFPFLFLTSDKKLRGEGFCTKCRAPLNCNWLLEALIENCPPSPPPPPALALGSDPAIPFEELFTAEDRSIIMGDDKLFR